MLSLREPHCEWGTCEYCELQIYYFLKLIKTGKLSLIFIKLYNNIKEKSNIYDFTCLLAGRDFKLMNIKESGFILINKPSGPTSHDVIDKLRRITGIKKIGHAGTLDPFAHGLLIVAIGREATREIDRFVKLDKEYVADLYLGATTDTYDREGKISYKVESKKLKVIDKNKIKKILKKFIGKQKQVPPMYSAKKIKGKKLYELARKGIEIQREAVEIMIYELEIRSYEWPRLKIKVKCSSGTYIRSLAYDVGEVLGCGAYLEELERTAIGKLKLSEAVSVKELDDKSWENKLIFF